MAKKKSQPSPEQLQRMRDTALQIEVWAKKPWRWIRDCCVTQDEADSSSPVKPFPDKEYLRYIADLWQRSSLLAIPKSRRMMLTWLMLALHLHKALFFPRSAIFIQSKKEDDSDFLLSDKRMLFIYENLPKNLPWPKVTRKFCSLEFSNGSYMRGIAQGPDQLRQYGVGDSVRRDGVLGQGGADVGRAEADGAGRRAGDDDFVSRSWLLPADSGGEAYR